MKPSVNYDYLMHGDHIHWCDVEAQGISRCEAQAMREHSAAAGKASALVPVIDGISERVLPDGRVAFLAQSGAPAAEQLTAACKGRAIWNPRFRNWLCSAEQAAEIRDALHAQPAREPT